MINDFFNLIFPRICCSCNSPLAKTDRVICVRCIISLPKTNFHLSNENPVSKMFWGRVDIEMATSFYMFSKKSRVQNLLHNLKYKGGQDIGFVVGELFGSEINRSPFFKGIDVIVPVPLHEVKKKKRGYNQSECIALGISKIIQKSVNTKSLFRKVDSNTQTKKKRFERWQNVDEIFGLANDELSNKTVLLVDDVITTGATIEACAQVLIQQNCRVMVATLAYA